MALARAHDIKLPEPHVPENRAAIAKAAFGNPKFTTTPAVRLLFIPQSPTQPLQQMELKNGPDFQKDVCRVLGCDLSDAVVLHSEDQMAYVSPLITFSVEPSISLNWVCPRPEVNRTVSV